MKRNLFEPHIDQINEYMKTQNLGYAKLVDGFIMLFNNKESVIGRFDTIGDEVMCKHLSTYNTAARLRNLAKFVEILQEIVFKTDLLHEDLKK